MVLPLIPNYCASCGAPLSQSLPQAGGGPPLLCTGCGRPVYLDPKLAVAGVVRVNGSVLLLRRAQRDQAYGRWILPGGHVDRGEEVSGAALREVREETGVRAELDGLLGVYSYPGHPVVLTVYLARAERARLAPSHEALEINLFRPQDIPWDHLGYRSTGDALRDWLKRDGLA